MSTRCELVDRAATVGGEKWDRSSEWRAGPTVFSAAMDKPGMFPTLSRPTMAAIEYRHTAAGFFLTDYPG